MKRDVVINGHAASLWVNGERLGLQRAGGGLTEWQYSAVHAADGTWSILIDGRSYTAIDLGWNQIFVNGVAYDVEAFDTRELRGRRMAAEGTGPCEVTAPMPGRVIRVLVETGEYVAAGEGLIVVEAMKMQNEMKSPRAGRISAVKTAADATISAGDILLVID